MKLFLTSQASEVLPDIAKRLPKAPNEYLVALVTTAAKPYENPWWLQDDRAKLVELGFNIKEIDIEGTSYEELKGLLKETTIIFVAGGNTIFLWEKFKESGFDTLVKEMLEGGVIYIGSSAGSVICGPSVEPSRVFDERKSDKLQDFTSLGFVDFVPLPHYHGKLDTGTSDSLLEKYKNSNLTLRPMADTQYYWVKDGVVELVGVGK